MSPRRNLALLPACLLLLVTAACGDDEDDGAAGDDTTAAVIGEDATVAWSSSFEEDWSPVDVVQIGDVLVVSESWSIDEGSGVRAYDVQDGTPLWTYGGTYGAPLVSSNGSSDQVVVCDDEDAVLLSTADGSEAGPADEEDCDAEGDDETGTEFGGKGGPLIDRYHVSGTTLTVEGEDGSYDVPLEDDEPEIWTVDGAVVTFTEETWELRLYR